jgi:hypothetical protein
MKYTDGKIKCERCGKKSHTSSRYCEICGHQLFISLDSPEIKNAEFIDIFNSVYSLVGNKENPYRKQFINKVIDDCIFKRGKELFDQLWQYIIRTRIAFKGLGDPLDKDIEPLILYECQYSSSTTLAGYALRIAEEIYSQKGQIKLSDRDIAKFIQDYINNYTENNDNQSGSKLEKLSHALCYDNNYLKYNLIDKHILDKYLTNIVGQNWEIELKIKEDLFTKLYQSKGTAQKIIDKEKRAILLETFSDFIYGYSLRISSVSLSII